MTSQRGGELLNTTPTGASVRLGEARGRWVLLAAVLGSGMAMLDSTVVNVALPTLGRQFDASLAGLQWTVNGYTLTLAALILLGGALGDRYGRRRVFSIGVAWFATASLLCGLAPNLPALVAARALQGVGGALLTPGSLAMIQASFVPADRARAVGAWSGLAGIAGALGPFLGGWLLELSWRLIFWINVPVAVLVLAVTARHVPESRSPASPGRFDVLGAVLGALGLAGITAALVRAGESGWSGTVLVTGLVGALAVTGFVLRERAAARPMLPFSLFSSAQFAGANAVTFAMYAALGGVFFFVALQLQVSAGFPPLAAGASLLPITVLMLLLSARAGALAQRIGPRLPMTVGPLVCGVGVLLLSRIGPGSAYLPVIFPATVVFGLGLSLTVAPLTAAVLAAADVSRAGIASGVNNAVARAAGLLAVAVLPLTAGLTGDAYRDPAVFTAGFRLAMVQCAVLLAVGGLLAWATIRRLVEPRTVPERHATCPVDGPPLEHLVSAPAVRAGGPV
jgi:EmrB/QacA subfamily drug resistance transporter